MRLSDADGGAGDARTGDDEEARVTAFKHFRREGAPMADSASDEDIPPADRRVVRSVAIADTAAVLSALDAALLAAETAAAQLHARVQDARTQMAIVRARAQDDAAKLAKLDAVQRALQD
jgi:hypothetical protein